MNGVGKTHYIHRQIAKLQVESGSWTVFVVYMLVRPKMLLYVITCVIYITVIYNIAMCNTHNYITLEYVSLSCVMVLRLRYVTLGCVTLHYIRLHTT